MGHVAEGSGTTANIEILRSIPWIQDLQNIFPTLWDQIYDYLMHSTLYINSALNQCLVWSTIMPHPCVLKALSMRLQCECWKQIISLFA